MNNKNNQEQSADQLTNKLYKNNNPKSFDFFESSFLILKNRNFLTIITASLLSSILQSYFAILVKFNSNSIFSNSESSEKHMLDEKFFNFIFFKSSLGVAKNPYWSIMLFSFILFCYCASVAFSFLFSYLNRELTKISEKEILSKLESFQISNSEKKKQKNLIENDISEKITTFFVLFISFFQLVFEGWFFCLSSLLKNGRDEKKRVQLYFVSSLVCFSLYYTGEKIFEKLSSKLDFLRENNNTKPFLSKSSSILPKENFSFYDVFPSIFSPFYFLTFVLSSIKSEKKLASYAPLRVESFLFAAYMTSFLKKISILFESAKKAYLLIISNKKISSTSKNDHNWRHTQVAEGVSFEN